MFKLSPTWDIEEGWDVGYVWFGSLISSCVWMYKRKSFVVFG